MIRKDRRERIWRVSEEIEERLAKGDIIGAFENLKGWYRKHTGKTIKPSKETIEKTRKTYEDLFTADEDVGNEETLYDFEYEGEEVKDDVPDEEEIREALMRMRNRKAPGLTGISVDKIKEWYNSARPKEGEGDEIAIENWRKVVNIVQAALRDGKIPDAFSFGILVIIPKDDEGGVRGIGLLETIRKLISNIINLRIAKAVEFDEYVHGSRRKRGTYTAIGERKMKMQMAVCESTTLYQVYLDLKKAYDSVDRKKVMWVLEKYRVGPNLRRYINEVWKNQRYILRQGGFYSDTVQVGRGCTQGDTDFPIIFNLRGRC